MPFGKISPSKWEILFVHFVIKISASMAFISKICNVSKAIDILLVSDNEESDSFEISGNSDEDSRIKLYFVAILY